MAFSLLDTREAPSYQCLTNINPCNEQEYPE